MTVEVALADVSELRGAGIDVLTDQVIAGRSASNDPKDIAEAEEKAKPKQEEKPKTDDGITKRIGELTRKQREAERAAAAEREARTAAERERDELKQKLEAKPVEVPKRPKREDFDDQDAYDDACFDYRIAVREAAKVEKKPEPKSEPKVDHDAVKRQQEEAARIAAQFEESVETARKAHDDFDEVLKAGERVMLKPHLLEALVFSESAGELQYHFAKNPEVVEKLNGMEQVAMLKELGRIELSLEPKPSADGAGDQPRGADGKFVPKEVSAAAEPIKPVNRSDETASGTKDPERMSVNEHREAAFRASRSR